MHHPSYVMFPADRLHCRTECTPAAAVSCAGGLVCAPGAEGYTCVGKKKLCSIHNETHRYCCGSPRCGTLPGYWIRSGARHTIRSWVCSERLLFASNFKVVEIFAYRTWSFLCPTRVPGPIPYHALATRCPARIPQNNLAMKVYTALHFARRRYCSS